LVKNPHYAIFKDMKLGYSENEGGPPDQGIDLGGIGLENTSFSSRTPPEKSRHAKK